MLGKYSSIAAGKFEKGEKRGGTGTSFEKEREKRGKKKRKGMGSNARSFG